MLRLSVIKSCFVFPDGVSLPLGWGWRPRCCGRGGRVALTSDWGRLSPSRFPDPQNRVSPIGEIGRRDGFKFRCLRACRFESCIGDIMIILLRTAVLRRVIFFYAEERRWFIVQGRGGRRTFRRIGRGFVRLCSRGMGIGVRRFCLMVVSVRVLARSSVIIWVILRIIRCKRSRPYVSITIVGKRPRTLMLRCGRGVKRLMVGCVSRWRGILGCREFC